MVCVPYGLCAHQGVASESSSANKERRASFTLIDDSTTVRRKSQQTALVIECDQPIRPLLRRREGPNPGQPQKAPGLWSCSSRSECRFGEQLVFFHPIL